MPASMRSRAKYGKHTGYRDEPVELARRAKPRQTATPRSGATDDDKLRHYVSGYGVRCGAALTRGAGSSSRT